MDGYDFIAIVQAINEEYESRPDNAFLKENQILSIDSIWHALFVEELPRYIALVVVEDLYGPYDRFFFHESKEVLGKYLTLLKNFSDDSIYVNKIMSVEEARWMHRNL